MTKRETIIRKLIFTILFLIQAVFFIEMTVWTAPLIQTRMKRYPHAFLGDKMLSGILSIVNCNIYGIFICSVINILLIFEVLKKKKISPLLTFDMMILAFINYINAGYGYLTIPFLPCLITAITTDVLFVACAAIWTVKLVKHYRAKRNKLQPETK